jgi:hypothetical protein
MNVTELAAGNYAKGRMAPVHQLERSYCWQSSRNDEQFGK